MSAADVEDVEVGGEALQALQVGTKRRNEQERAKMRENKEFGISALVIITSFNLTVFHFLKPTSSAGCVKKSQNQIFLLGPANSNSSPATILIVARLILIVGQPIVSHPPVQTDSHLDINCAAKLSNQNALL